MGSLSTLIGQRTFKAWTIFGLLGIIALATIAFVGIAAANPSCTNSLVGSNFEVENPGTPNAQLPGANLKVDNGAAGCIDWLTGGTGTGLRSDVITQDDEPSGSNDDAFGQGTKENTANPTIVRGSIPPNKSDLKVFGVHTETNANSKFLQLFWTRVQNPSGTTNMDFELNKKFCDPTATPTNCANNGAGVTPETPVRSTGDKLITYDLSNGGTVPTISIRTWTQNNQWGSPTVISGGTGANACNANTGNNCAIGSVNTVQIPANQTGGINLSPSNVALPLDAFTFGEATIDFKALFSSTGPCGSFGSAYLKSRSSDAFNAELKDFIKPHKVDITNCTGLATTATQKATIGSPISDTATLSGGNSPTGTITFHLFPSLADCQNNTNEINTGLSPVTVNGNGTYPSGDFTPSAIGTYYWLAEYSGDTNNAASKSACDEVGEQSEVVIAKPALTTTASGPVTIGSAIHDTAHLSGGVSPTGTISFRVFSDDTCSTEVTPSGGLSTTVNGNGNYDSPDFTPTSAGSYYWTAKYSGDAKNAEVSTSCNEAGETSVVEQKQPTLTTTASGPVTIGSAIHDTAHLSGGVSPTGTITFKVYKSLADCNANTNVLFTDTVNVTSGNGDYDSGDFTPSAVGSYFWIASYSGDDNNKSAATACGDDGETSVVNKAAAAVATAQQLFPQDSATVSATAGGTPTGTVDFALYGPNDANCSGTAVFTQNDVSLTNGTANTNNTSFSVKQADSGNYKWIVHYDGDNKHEEATSACGKEAFTATIDNDTTN